MSLYANINKRKKAGTSRSKSDSTITKKNYDNMKKDFKEKGGMMKYQTGGKKSKIKIGGITVLPKGNKKTKTTSSKNSKVSAELNAAYDLGYSSVEEHNKANDKTKPKGHPANKTSSAIKKSKIKIGGITVKKAEKSYKKLGGFRDTFLEPGIPNLDSL